MLDIFGVGFILIAIVILLKVVKIIKVKFYLSDEVGRKSIHIAMGLTICSFPWLFSSSFVVWGLAVLVSILFMSIRYYKRFNGVGEALYSVNRTTYGELYFTWGMAILFELASSPLLFIVPVLILTFSDAIAALVGVRYGTKTITIFGSKRSIEGSSAFVLSSFIIIAGALYFVGGFSIAIVMSYSLLMALVLSIVEAVSVHGLDNFTLPLGTLLLLELILI